MEPKVLIVGTDINAYYMARCYHEIYHEHLIQFPAERYIFLEK